MTGLAAALLFSATLGPAPAPEAGHRVALLVGSDIGFADELPLRFTGADAERLGDVLRELGGFAAADVHVLKNRGAGEILDALDVLTRGPPASVFVFYFSGHADASALHPAGTILPVDLLLHRLHGVEADLRISILDACQSGSATRAKGSSPAAPFQVRVDDQSLAGDILISSSAADEQSFEGEHGGLFTLNWTAGLRGAADGNEDGQVTVSEAYEYAYAQTLRSTLAAAAGPQHARFRYELSGRRDPVLTRLSGGALLTLMPRSDGEYVIFDGRERSVVAELPSRPGEPRRLALAAGSYVVQQRGPRSLRLARIQLVQGDDRVLSEHQMQEVPLLRLARKGSLGEGRVIVSAGQSSSGLGPRGHLIGLVGAEREGDRWLSGVDLAFSTGEERHRQLSTHDTLLQASASLLYSLREGAASLRLGPVAGAAWLRQATAARDALNTLAVSLGVRLRADTEVIQGIGLYVQIEGRALALRAVGSALQPWVAYGAGLRFAF